MFMKKQISLITILSVCWLLNSPASGEKNRNMVLIPAQTFIMGDVTGQGQPDQTPAHPVIVSAFYLSPYLCTVQEYCDFLNDTQASLFEENYIVRKGVQISTYRDRSEVLVIYPGCPLVLEDAQFVPLKGKAWQPICYVSWEGAALYCNWLSEQQGLKPCYYPEKNFVCDFSANGYHLPTEAQWECAARAGHASFKYPWGDKISRKQANYDNCLGHATDVGCYRANDYGLYDMAGNVLEWCHDWYGEEYYQQCSAGVKNPDGPDKGGFHVIRGGAYYQPANFQTCAYRYGTADTKACFSYTGFRVARNLSHSSELSGRAQRTQGTESEMNDVKNWIAGVFDSNIKNGSYNKLPFSFILNGKPSSKFLKGWKADVGKTMVQGQKKIRVIYFRDPKTKLEIACEITTYEDFPAVDLLLRVTNNGVNDSGILEDVCVLDHTFTRQQSDGGEFMLRRSRGSRASSLDFAPYDEILLPNEKRTLGGHGGRSCDYDFPFINLAWDDGGVVLGVGWTGQWRTQFERDAKKDLRLQVGLEQMHLKLHPGESIRSARLLMVFWEGDSMYRGHNLFRQTMIAHYSPRLDGKPIIPPIAAGVGGLNGYTEENQLAAIPKLAERGIEVLWIDAGWFVGGWPFGAGNWVPKPDNFPRGLGPVGKAVHEAGMDFLVWFEPQRVSRDSMIAHDYPQWCVGPITEYGGLFNWGIPEARQWMTDFLSEQIQKGNIDVFRQDFNMEPLFYWQCNDTPDREGMTQIRFVEGMYQMWDQMRERQKGLWIDNCASGGRQIDLETSMRSIPLWQSDAQCDGCPDMTCQLQNGGLNLYLPFHSGGCFGLEPSYSFRSAMMSGNVLCLDVVGTPAEKIQQTVEMFHKVRPYFEGDYYPLFPHLENERVWYGYQLSRPDLQKGMIVLFRRALAPDASKILSLYDIDPEGTYTLFNKDEGRTETLSGAELKFLNITIDKSPDSRVLFYEKQ